VALITLALVASPVASLAQEAATDDAVGVGGRVEVPEAGYAATLPPDWLHIRPSRADLDVILQDVDILLPGLGPTVAAALAGGLRVSLIAFADDAEGLPESCNILDRAADGRPLDAIAQDELAKLSALSDIIASGPDLAFVDLSAGRTARLDVGLRLPEIEAESSTYIFVDQDWIHTLTCTDDVRPDDAWARIIETLEPLPATD
jgi:hypothetical protein